MRYRKCGLHLINLSGTWSNIQLNVVMQMEKSASRLYVLYVWENLAQLVSHLPCNASVPGSNPKLYQDDFFFLSFFLFLFLPCWNSIPMT